MSTKRYTPGVWGLLILICGLLLACHEKTPGSSATKTDQTKLGMALSRLQQLLWPNPARTDILFRHRGIQAPVRQEIPSHGTAAADWPLISLTRCFEKSDPVTPLPIGAAAHFIPG